MAGPITISQFRVSFIWFETILTLLCDIATDKQTAPFHFLGRNNTYESMFNQIKHNPVGAPKLTLPWRNMATPGHSFWYYYLHGIDTTNITARLAWKGFVPFRGMAPYDVGANWILSPGQFLQEAFYYPHGVAFVATAYCQGDFTLDQFVELALKFRKNGQFRNNTTAQSLYLSDLAANSLDHLRAAGWGDKEAQGDRTSEPFTILTVVKGDGVDKGQPPNQEIQQALERVTLWSDDYKNIAPVDLYYNDIISQDALLLSLPVKQQADLPPCDALYAAKNSRTVWFPRIFLPGGEKTSASLAAYHRDLTLSSLQVESLCGLIGTSYDRLNDPIPPVLSECLRRALTYLEQLYGGKKSYHSYSARVQLDWHEELKEIVNTVRAFWNLNPLARETPV